MIQMIKIAQKNYLHALKTLKYFLYFKYFKIYVLIKFNNISFRDFRFQQIKFNGIQVIMIISLKILQLIKSIKNQKETIKIHQKKIKMNLVVFNGIQSQKKVITGHMNFNLIKSLVLMCLSILSAELA